jgi:hypothetical protein
MLETVVAIGVLVTGVFATFALVRSNIRLSTEASLRFVAVQSAREGLEVVRGMRDSNWLAGDEWDEGLSRNGRTTNIVAPFFDPTVPGWSLHDLPDGFDDDRAQMLRVRHGDAIFWTQDDQTGLAEEAETPYRRIVTLHAICADYRVVEDGQLCSEQTPAIGMRVASFVRWEHRGAEHEIVAEERLYNWR